MSEQNQEPELVVDTDWKNQVEKEKELTQQDADGAAPEDLTGDLPPASLGMLISTFYSQAMMSLGVIANPATGEKKSDLRLAKHFIDTLEMLEQKTKGNVDDDEVKMFDEVLHLLRMAYVGARKS